MPWESWKHAAKHCSSCLSSRILPASRFSIGFGREGHEPVVRKSRFYGEGEVRSRRTARSAFGDRRRPLSLEDGTSTGFRGKPILLGTRFLSSATGTRVVICLHERRLRAQRGEDHD